MFIKYILLILFFSCKILFVISSILYNI